MTYREREADREMIAIFVDGFERRVREIRTGPIGSGAAAVMRLRAAADLEACAEAVKALLPPDPHDAATQRASARAVTGFHTIPEEPAP